MRRARPDRTDPARGTTQPRGQLRARGRGRGGKEGAVGGGRGSHRSFLIFVLILSAVNISGNKNAKEKEKKKEREKETMGEEGAKRALSKRAWRSSAHIKGRGPGRAVGGINITTERGAGPGAEGLGGTPSHLRVPPGGPRGPQPPQRPVPRAGAQRARSECGATAADDLYDCNWL